MSFYRVIADHDQSKEESLRAEAQMWSLSNERRNEFSEQSINNWCNLRSNRWRPVFVPVPHGENGHHGDLLVFKMIKVGSSDVLSSYHTQASAHRRTFPRRPERHTVSLDLDGIFRLLLTDLNYFMHQLYADVQKWGRGSTTPAVQQGENHQSPDQTRSSEVPCFMFWWNLSRLLTQR